jgi:hypothetical protein
VSSPLDPPDGFGIGRWATRPSEAVRSGAPTSPVAASPATADRSAAVAGSDAVAAPVAGSRRAIACISAETSGAPATTRTGGDPAAAVGVKVLPVDRSSPVEPGASADARFVDPAEAFATAGVAASAATRCGPAG